MEAGPPDFGSFVQDVDDETLLAAARNEEGENEFVEDVADVLLNEVGEAFDRQFSYQSQLGGAALSSSAPPGSFEFLLDPFVDRRSERMGVRERHYTTRLRQRGAFIPSQHEVSQTLRQPRSPRLRQQPGPLQCLSPDWMSGLHRGPMPKSSGDADLRFM